MGLWILLGIGLILLLVLLRVREHYVIIEGPGARPTRNAEWLSKIDAQAPIGGNDDDYVKVLQKFYDEIYEPARKANPTVFIKDTEVKTFADSVTIPGVDKESIRKIITAGFAVDRTGTAAEREKKETVTTGALAGFKGENLQPSMGVDEVRTRTELTYTPSDSRKGKLPEGEYSPVPQSEPRREGNWDDKSTSWNRGQFYGVCEGEECAKNVV
jgi:hypothetical protein